LLRRLLRGSNDHLFEELPNLLRFLRESRIGTRELLDEIPDLADLLDGLLKLRLHRVGAGTRGLGARPHHLQRRCR